MDIQHKILPKTDAELKQLAIDILDGKVFTDMHVRDPQDLAIIFLPIGFGGFSELTDEEIPQIGLVYEYLDQRGPLDVNGCPSFFSLKYLTKEETDRMIGFYEEYSKLKKHFVESN